MTTIAPQPRCLVRNVVLAIALVGSAVLWIGLYFIASAMVDAACTMVGVPL
jgi:phage shock protein PspC (stress-responsive transcriptional regulator)